MKNFLNILEVRNPKFVIVPFPLEMNVSYEKGTKFGPREIIRASAEVELWDEELKKHPYKKGIKTLKEIKIAKTAKKALSQLEKIVDEILEDKKFPIVLGGEHSLTFGAISAFAKKYKNFTILHFDAHADLRKSYLGNKYSHSAVMQRILKKFRNLDVIQVDVRNISNDEDGEYDFYQKNRNRIKIFWAWNKKWRPRDILRALKKKYVYLSFDVDCFDPSIMPSTGTPEPDGLSWHEVIEILKVVSQKKQLIGADFVELAPIKNLHAPNFLVAKLIYKFISLVKTP